MTPRPTSGITRKVTFTPWCSYRSCGWRGEPQDYKGDAAYLLAQHAVDQHGGTPRVGSEDDVPDARQLAQRAGVVSERERLLSQGVRPSDIPPEVK